MSSPRGRLIILGIVSCWPALYMLAFFVVVSAWARMSDRHGASVFTAVALVHLATILLTIGLLVWYLHYLCATDRVPSDKKALWAAVLILGNALAFPAFFYWHVWNPSVPEPPLVGNA